MIAKNKLHLRVRITTLVVISCAILMLLPVIGEWILFSSASSGNVSLTRRLIVCGVDPNTPRADRGNAVVRSAESGHLENLKILLMAGADPNSHTDTGRSALMFAAENGHIEIVKLLINAGANVNMSDGGGYTALSLAQGQNEIISLIRLHSVKK